MKNTLEIEKNTYFTRLRPMLLAVSKDQLEARCPACASQINEENPPYDSRIADTYPLCPHCRQALDIQCRDIDLTTTFGDMNDAQHEYALSQFRRIGGALIKLQSGNYQLLFAGSRTTLGANVYVMNTYNGILSKLEDMQMNQRNSIQKGVIHV